MEISVLEKKIANEIWKHTIRPEKKGFLAEKALHNVETFITSGGIRDFLEEYIESLLADIRREVNLSKP